MYFPIQMMIAHYFSDSILRLHANMIRHSLTFDGLSQLRRQRIRRRFEIFDRFPIGQRLETPLVKLSEPEISLSDLLHTKFS